MSTAALLSVSVWLSSSRPDWIDYSILSACGLGLLLAIGLGYWFAVVDLRAWVRSFSRVLTRAAYYMPEVPGWARRETPRCLSVFGMRLPCKERDLLAAYRRKVKRLHPDHGGDQRRFLQIQAYFEEAQELVRNEAEFARLKTHTKR